MSRGLCVSQDLSTISIQRNVSLRKLGEVLCKHYGVSFEGFEVWQVEVQETLRKRL